MEDFKRLFKLAEDSSFLKGGNGRSWSASFDWLIADANMAKTLDGNYSDRHKGKGGAADGMQSGNSFKLLSKFGFDSYSHDMGNLRKITEDFLRNYLERWEKSGKGLYLWSKTPGSGKTFLTCCLGKSVMIKYDLRMRFTTVPDYLAKVGESYKRQQGECDESTVYRDCDLLIFDDIGTQKSGEWQQQEVFRIINERLNAGKIIIFTSNMCPEDLNLDNRTIDRIMKKSVVLQMPEESIRRRETKEEQDDFLRDILHTQSGK